MKSVSCLLLIIALLLSGLAFISVEVRGTTVGGAITSDTRWTTNESPITVNASGLRVYPNATLTIDPGVTVNLGYNYFRISGMLIAIGTPDNKITFTIPDNQTFGFPSISFDSTSQGWNDVTSSGSILQYVAFNKVYLQIGSSIKVDECEFSFSATSQTAITISGGGSLGTSPIISNNKIVFSGQDASHYSYGLSINSGATPFINNNEFDGNGQLTGINLQIYTPSGMSNPAFAISNNIFSNCWLGIKAETAATITVQGNSFLRCHDGLDISSKASLTIRNNLIDGCSRYGINGGTTIESNTISNNQIGIHNPSAGSVISNNNIVGNSVNSITASSASVSAQNNWWGIADEATIKSTLYDVSSDSSLGTITFMPFLSSPSTSAPAIPANTPPTTPAPAATSEPTTRPTITSTPVPTIPPTATPTKKSETILNANESGDLINLNLISTATGAVLALIWVVVILGYVAISCYSRFKAKNETASNNS